MSLTLVAPAQENAWVLADTNYFGGIEIADSDGWSRSTRLHTYTHPTPTELGEYLESENHVSWTLFSGVEGSKQPQDLGVNAHFGGRLAVNHGRVFPQFRDIGIQLGTSLNATANAVQVLERLEGTDSRLQSFTTVGLFQRLPQGLSWGVGYDFLYQDYFDQAWLGQWRLQGLQFVTDRDELGLMIAISGRSEEVEFLGDRFRFRPLTHGRLMWRRHWESGTYTTAWAGLAASHSETNVALGDLAPTGRQLLIGSDFRAPLNQYVSIYGEANILMPVDTGGVDAFLGLEFIPQRFALDSVWHLARPVLPVAGNPSFLVDGARQ